MAWTRGSMICLNDLEVMGRSTSATKQRKYAKSTHTPVDLVQKYIAREVPSARSFGAIPIEVNNSIWGVLVLDSRDPGAISLEAMDNYKITVAMLSRLLEDRI